MDGNATALPAWRTTPAKGARRRSHTAAWTAASAMRLRNVAESRWGNVAEVLTPELISNRLTPSGLASICESAPFSSSPSPRALVRFDFCQVLPLRPQPHSTWAAASKMPFDFQKYDQKCQGMDQEELQKEWQHYTRLISGASTSTAVSGLALPLTAGISAIGVGLAAPAIHNARKKRDIIERHLNRLGTTHNTRKRDVFSGVAVSGTIGVVTMGVGAVGADAVATAGAEHGIAAIVEHELAIKIVSHAALDGAGMGLEHMYTHHVKAKEANKAFQKAGVFQAVADAKAQEAGYAIPPYGAQAQPHLHPQAPYEPVYEQIAPPPPYSAATAPNGFVPDLKTPAATFTQAASPGYHYAGPPPPQYGYGQQPRDQTQQQTGSQPQTSFAPATYLPSQVATGPFDMTALAYSLPASTPAPEQQQQHQQYQAPQRAMEQQQHQAVSTPSNSQAQAHTPSQPISYEHPEHSTSPLKPSLVPTGVTAAPETPNLYAPTPAPDHWAVSAVTDYASQPTPALRQDQQDHLQATQPPYQDLAQQSPVPPPHRPDLQQYPQQTVPPPLQTPHQSASHQYPQPVQQPHQPEMQTLIPHQSQVQAQQQYQAASATYHTSPEQQTGTAGFPHTTALAAPTASDTSMSPPQAPPPSYHQPSTLPSYSSTATSQRPASTIYFPPPPTTAPPNGKQAPPAPAPPVVGHNLSFPIPPPSTAPPSALQGYPIPGAPYAGTSVTPIPQPAAQQRSNFPQQYQFAAYNPQHYQRPQSTPQPQPQQHSYPVYAQQPQQHEHKQPPYQPQQAAAPQQSYSPYTQQQAPVQQPPPPPPPGQIAGFPPTPLSPPQSAQNTSQGGYFPPRDPHQQQQQPGAQCPPNPQQQSGAWNRSGQPQWQGQAPYTPAATPAWTGY